MKNIQDFITKNRFGSDSRLKFKNDPREYYLKNFHPNGTHVFVTGPKDLGRWAKRIENIIEHNGKPVIMVESINFEIDWSSVNHNDLMKFSEAIAPDYSMHAIERAYERSDQPFIKVKEDVEELIDKAQDEMIDLSNQFKTFIIKGKNNLNVVGSLIKRGKDYIFRVITVMWKKFFIPKNPNDKVIKIEEAKEIKINNLLNLKEMEGQGKSKNMSINDIAILHKITIESIKQQLAMGIPIESKEHTYDLAKAKQIAMDHLVENPNYYTDYISKMEPLDRDIKTESKEVLKEVEPVDVNQTIEEEPTAIVSEETQAKVELKREVQDVANSLEDIIINAEEWNNAVPIKVNALSRVNSILKATKSLALDLEASTNLVAESVEQSKEVITERRKLLTDELKDFNFKFEKLDVLSVISAHYKVDYENDNMVIITVRNPHYDSNNPLSTLNYKLAIYYGDNYVAVYSEREDEIGNKLALNVEREIIQDLAHMNDFKLPSDFMSRHMELVEGKKKTLKESVQDNAIQSFLNDLLQRVIKAQFYNEETGIEINKIESNQESQYERKLETISEEDYERYKFYIDYELMYNFEITNPELIEKAQTIYYPNSQQPIIDLDGSDYISFNIEAEYLQGYSETYEIKKVDVCGVSQFEPNQESRKLINEVFKPIVAYV